MKKLVLKSIKFLLKVATSSKYVEEIFRIVNVFNDKDISNTEKLVQALQIAERLADTYGVNYNKNIAKLIIELAVAVSKM